MCMDGDNSICFMILCCGTSGGEERKRRVRISLLASRHAGQGVAQMLSV